MFEGPSERRRRRLRSPVRSARHLLDRPLWKFTRRRYQAFQGAELLVSRTRAHEAGDVATGEPRLDAAFADWFDRSEEHEYFFRTLGPGLIDPRHGFVFLGPTQVALHSLNPRCSPWMTARSSVTSALVARGSRRTLHLEAAVSLRDFHDHNYWHAICDVFAKLLLAAEAGVPDDVPAIVGHRLAGLRSWPDLEQVFTRFRPIIVQPPDVFIHAGTVYAGATLNNDANVFDAFLDRLDGVAPPTEGSAARRAQAIFVTRNPTRARAVANLAEVHEICAAREYAIVDYDEMSFSEARAVTANASVIAGFHGAGLTNMMFRRGSHTRIGELVMENHIAPEYFVLARHLGFPYQAMLCPVVENGGDPSCRVDPQRFDALLTSLRAGPSATRRSS